MDVRLALTGFGSVGQGLATLLAEQGETYRDRYGIRLVLTGVADRSGAAVNPDGLDPAALLAAKRQKKSVAASSAGSPGLHGREFVERAEAQVLVEAASTNFVDAEPGWSYARDALSRGMDVVLASKGALVLHYGELMDDARKRQRRVLFAGTVGAPLPVDELARRALVGADIHGFEGIVNATTNLILTLMASGMSFAEGVRVAQEAGLAETDPTLDVEGWDAAAKVVIIARAVLGADITLEDVERQGIREVSAEELRTAELRGEAIKLVASAFRDGDAIKASVRPTSRPLGDALGRLRDQEMGIVFHTDPLGAVTSTVQRTGGLQTALTLLRDVVNLARERGWTAPE